MNAHGFNSFSPYMQYIENSGVQLQCPYFPTPQNLESLPNVIKFPEQHLIPQICNILPTTPNI